MDELDKITLIRDYVEESYSKLISGVVVPECMFKIDSYSISAVRDILDLIDLDNGCRRVDDIIIDYIDYMDEAMINTNSKEQRLMFSTASETGEILLYLLTKGDKDD